MAEEVRLDVVAVAHSKGLTDAARDVRHLKGEADNLTHSFGQLEDGSFDLDRAIEETRLEVTRLRSEFARTGDRGFLRDLREQENDLKRLARLSKDLFPSPTEDDNIHDLRSMLGSIPSVGRGALIGSAVGLGVLMAPAIGAIVSGAVVGAAGAGGIVGGVIAASKDARVQAAWKDFTSHTFSAEQFGGPAFVQPTIAALGELRDAFEEADIGDVLSKAAGFVEPLAEGIGGFVKNIMPGFSEALDNAGPVIDELASGVADTGKALGDMMRDMSQGESAAAGMRYTFALVNGAIHVLGDTMHGLGEAFVFVRDTGEATTGVMEDVANWGSAAAPGLSVVSHWFSVLNDDLERLQGTGSPTMHSMSEGVELVAGEMQYGTDVIKVYTAAWSDLLEMQMQADRAAIDYEKTIDDLSESVKENGTTLDIHTEAGRRNRAIFLDMVEDAQRARERMLADPNMAAAANVAYEKQIAKIREIGAAAGFTKKQLDDMVGNYIINVTTKFKQIGNPSGSPNAPWGGGFQEFAEGGWVQGPKGSPQLAVVHGGEYVVSNAMQAGARPVAGGMGMSARPLQISGGGLGDVFMSWLSGEVQARGGTVAVLGVRE